MRPTNRQDDPDWVYRGFLRALKNRELHRHEEWQLERVGVGDPEETADAIARLELVAEEFSHRARIRAERNGHRNSSIEGFEIDSPPGTEEP